MSIKFQASGHGDRRSYTNSRHPRIVLRQDVIAGITNQLKESGIFHEKYALHVRPIEGGLFQILQGHHRVEAAKIAEVKVISCWSEQMDDPYAKTL